MSVDEERSIRPRAPSYKVLVETEDNLKSDLNAHIRSVDELKESCDPDILKGATRNLRQIHDSYRKASVELSSWYDKNGSHSSVIEVDEDRRNLFQEYKLSYNKIKNRINELGLPPASSVGDPSEYGANSEVSRSESVKDWLSKATESIEGASNNLLDCLGAVRLISKTNDISQSPRMSGTLNLSNSLKFPEIGRNGNFSDCFEKLSVNEVYDASSTKAIPQNLGPTYASNTVTAQANMPYFNSSNVNLKRVPSNESVLSQNNFHRGADASGYYNNTSVLQSNRFDQNVVSENSSVHNSHGADFLSSREPGIENFAAYGSSRTAIDSAQRIKNLPFHDQTRIVGKHADLINDNTHFRQNSSIFDRYDSRIHNYNLNSNVQLSHDTINRSTFQNNLIGNQFNAPSSSADGKKCSFVNHPNLSVNNSDMLGVSSNECDRLPPELLNRGSASQIDPRGCNRPTRGPIQSDVVREYMRMDLLKGGDSYLKFDGTKPEDFWGWHDELSSKLSAAGFDLYHMETIHVLRAHLDKRPKELVCAYINAGIDDPESVLHEIWRTLISRYGSNDVVSDSTRKKILNFRNIIDEDDVNSMEDLHALCLRIRRLSKRCDSLRHYSSPEGMRELWTKMPNSFGRKWRVFYTEQQERGRPITFEHFLEHMEKFIRIHSNPMFRKEISRGRAKVFLTSADEEQTENDVKETGRCSIHTEYSNHSLIDCAVFKNYNYEERRNHAVVNRLCFNCLGEHHSRFCRSKVKCTKCKGPHIFLMHNDYFMNRVSGSNRIEGNIDKFGRQSYQRRTEQGKPILTASNETELTHSLCTSLSQDGRRVRVCSKTLPVMLRLSGGSTLKCLAIIDEQSSHTFVDDRVISLLNIPSDKVKDSQYSLTTLEGLNTNVNGSTVSDLQVKGIKDGKWIKLPPSLTHPALPDTSDEAAGPDIVRQHGHIKSFAKSFTEVDPTLEVMVLIGTNCGEAMFTRCFGGTYPFVHKTALGYALVGPTCVPAAENSSVKVFRTSVQSCEHYSVNNRIFGHRTKSPVYPDIFLERPDDELSGYSKDQEEFMRIVSRGTEVNSVSKIVIPLAFKRNCKLPKNRQVVYHRMCNTLARIKRDPEKTKKCTEIVDDYIKRGHVKQLSGEEAKTVESCIPVFTVSNERKGKLRLVFDSSAKYKGVCLNDCLLQGPDETNRLIGVLVRFRHNEVAFSADVESMFHCFAVPEDQQKFQCFFWWANNDPSTNNIVLYSAAVHVFGHTSSPSVATYGLRFTTVGDTSPNRSKARQFIRRNFYVDDGLRSEDNVEEAISTLKEARAILSKFHIRLHKIASTHADVLKAFPPSEIAKDIDYVDISKSSTQSALGIRWRVDSDEFHLDCNVRRTDFTKRGILSAIGSLYDPLGIAAPVGLTGKLLQRRFFQATSDGDYGWDTELPHDFRQDWDIWISELHEVSLIKLRRSYRPSGFGEVAHSQLHVFCDASQSSIGHCIYLRQVNSQGDVSVSFVIGCSKVAPRAATSIPRLELCAALGATQASQYILSELDIPIDTVIYYSDSMVVLGYLRNRTKRFSRYVTSRVGGILASSETDQWRHIQTDMNPADIATREHTPRQLMNSSWLRGPAFLLEKDLECVETNTEDVKLPETIIETSVLCSKTASVNSIYNIFVKFPKWKSMLGVAAMVFTAVYRFKKQRIDSKTAKNLAKCFIVAEVQRQMLPTVYASLVKNEKISGENRIASLCPWLDKNDVIRVGGRLQRSEFEHEEKHPILLPPKHAVTESILSSCHDDVRHQGRHITAAAVRQAGYHILNPRSIISSFLKSCVTCQRLRGALLTQQMAQLPRDRIEQTAPFEKCGMDVFGHYFIHDGKSTRRSASTKKVWVLLMVCLYSRAVHMELLSSLDTPTFLMAFRRFIALRGNCSLVRSDHGSNFIGAVNQPDSSIDEKTVRQSLESKGCVWEFIPPRASHMAGVWERKVGTVKKVLTASVSLLKLRNLSRDEFLTLLQETSSIVNHTPLTEISCDPCEPFPVCPAMLLNMRESPMDSNVEFSEEDLLAYGSKRWRRTQYISDQFWVRWKREYILEQQTRNKWRYPVRNVSEGDVVLMKDSCSRSYWPMAVISQIIPSKDGLVRRVILRLKPSSSGKPQFRERAIHDLLLLVPKSSSSRECHDSLP